MTRTEQRFFADRIAVIQEISDGKKYTLDDVLKQHGEFIRDAKLKDFDGFAAMLIESDKLPDVYPPVPETSPDIPPDIPTVPASPEIAPKISQDVKPTVPAPRIYEGH